MPLSDFFVSSPWAVIPDVLEPMLQSLAGALSRPHGERLPDAKASSALGDTVPAGGYFLQDGVAIIQVKGVINREAGSFLWFAWEGQDRIRNAIQQAMVDPKACALLLSFDSPGGTAQGVKELADFIAAQSAKPIYAYADGLCASAAYWLASATGRVYAPVSASVGSIGVLYVHCDRSAANAAQGLHYTYITGGQWKAVGNEDAPLSSADHGHLQEMVSSLHDIFRNDVFARMPVAPSNPEAWGEGQLFLAGKAQELGLVTGVVTDRDALVALINKEISMDKAQLAAAHPELLAQIQAEAKAEAEQQAKVESDKVCDNILAMVRLVVGDEAVAKISALLETGMSAAQVGTFVDALGLSGLSAQSAAQGKPDQFDQEQASRKEILAALLQGTPAPINTSATVDGANPAMSAIERISKINT